MLVVHLLKTKKESKNLCKQEIQIIFTKMILIKFVFNMIWLMVSILIIQRQYLDADLADMQSISKCNKRITSLLCVIDLFSKYAWVVPLKDKKGVTIVYAFSKYFRQFKNKNQTWVDQGSEFYNNSFKKWLKDNHIEMYSTYNEGKSFAAERFVRTLEYKIYKHMTAASKNVYFDVLNNFVDEYNNTYHNTIKMNPIDVKSNSYAEYNVDSNDKDPKFKIDDHVRISRYKNIFAKKYTRNWFEEVYHGHVIMDLNGEEIVGTFYEKELQKTYQKEFRIEKVIKRKGNKLYVKWKGQDN